MKLDSLTSIIGRMTPRERRLFSVLIAAVIFVMLGSIYIGISSVFVSIREEIEHGRKVLGELYALAPKYMEAAEAKRQVEEAIRNNRQSVRVMANEMLKKIELADEIPAATGNTMADIVAFEGKTNDIPIEVGKPRKKGAKTKGIDSDTILQIEQTLEFREVPVVNLFSFLDQIENSKDLLFVTRLDIARKFNNLSHVRAVVTIATFQYAGEGPQPTEE